MRRKTGNKVGRPVDPKTKTLYSYVRPENREYARQMKKFFGSESNYIDALIEHDKKYDTLKNILVKKILKGADKLLAHENAHDES